MPEHFISFVIIGGILGFTGGYAGIGGAPILIAVTVFVFGYPQTLAQGTILAVMLGPMSLPSVILMKDRVKKYIPHIVLSVISYAMFSWVGAKGAYAVEEKQLKLFFGSLLIFIGLLNLFMSRFKKAQTDSKPPVIGYNKLSAFIISAIMGIVGGFFGIGAGILMVPLFTSLFKMDKDDARAVSLAILLPPVSLGAVLQYHQAGGINWKAAAIVFCAYFLTNHLGAKTGLKHSTGKFRYWFGIIMITMGLSYYLITLKPF